MDITSETTIGELQAHFGQLNGDHTLKITVEDGIFYAELRLPDDRVQVTAATLSDAMGHLGTWVDAMLQEPFMDHSALQASGMTNALHTFVVDRLSDLSTGEFVQRARATTVDVQALDQYWIALRRLVSFGLSVKASYNMVEGTGRIRVAAQLADQGE